MPVPFPTDKVFADKICGHISDSISPKGGWRSASCQVKVRQNQKTEESYGYSVFLVPAMTFIYLGTSLDASVYDMQILIPSLSSWEGMGRSQPYWHQHVESM